MTVNDFISNFPNFYELDSSEQTSLLAYFVCEINKETVTAPKLKDLFHQIDLEPYSNINMLLLRKSKKPNQYYIKKKSGYSLQANKKAEIQKLLGVVKKPMPTNDMLTLSSFENTRNYLIKIAEEINICYDTGLYTACLVLLRRLLETLIIEAFESKKISGKIEDSKGQYLFFSDLIDRYNAETDFHASRNLKNSFAQIKKIGDVCAHNRKFIAKKNHIDQIKTDIAVATEEILETIAY